MELHSRFEYGSLSQRVKDLVEEIKQLNHKIAGFVFIWRITRNGRREPTVSLSSGQLPVPLSNGYNFYFTLCINDHV